MKSAAEIQKGFAELFDPEEVSFRPGGKIGGDKAVVLAYLTSRAVMERLDEAAGIENWKTEFVVQAKGSMECRLSVRIAGEWITKADVGNPSEQPDAGDQLKSAYSDALKRAAVHFGIGRYLYKLKGMYHPYDPQTKRFKGVPVLPAWAIPKKAQDPSKAKKVASIFGFIRTLAEAHGVDPQKSITKKLGEWNVNDFIDLSTENLDTLLQQLNGAVANAAAHPPKKQTPAPTAAA